MALALARIAGLMSCTGGYEGAKRERGFSEVETVGTPFRRVTLIKNVCIPTRRGERGATEFSVKLLSTKPVPSRPCSTNQSLCSASSSILNLLDDEHPQGRRIVELSEPVTSCLKACSQAVPG
jgi:hypothetical protein